MKRFRLCLVVTLLAVLIAACEANDEPTEGPDVDPLEFAVELVELVEAGDWNAARDRYVSAFGELNASSIEEAEENLLVAANHLEMGAWSSVEDWDLETRADGTVVARTESAIDQGLVLVEEDGQWRYDPGPHVRFVAEQIEGGTEVGDPEWLEPRAESDPPQVGEIAVETAVGVMLRSVFEDEDGYVVTLLFSLHRLGEARLAEADIVVESENEEWQPEILWTDAGWQDGLL